MFIEFFYLSLSIFRKTITSVYIIYSIFKDIEKIKKNKWLSWEYCYKNNIIYTVGDFLYEFDIKSTKTKEIILFLTYLIILKIIIKIQIFFIFFFTIFKKLKININVKHKKNIIYNLFIFIPVKTAEKINIKTINKNNLYNLFINISMNQLFLFNRFNIDKALNCSKIHSKLKKNTHGSKKTYIIMWKIMKITVNDWKFYI